MKRIITIICLILFFVNTLAGIIISSYNNLIWVAADLIILLNYIFTIFLFNSNSSDGMKIGICFTNGLIFIFTLFLNIKMPDKIEDNFYLLAILTLLSIQLFLVVSSKYFKKISNN